MSMLGRPSDFVLSESPHPHMRTMHPNTNRLWKCCSGFACVCICWLTCSPVVAADGDNTVTYAEHVAPILTKHCAGCHNANDREGDFSLETLQDLQTGLEAGPVVVSGNSEESRLLQLMTGEQEPRMPPEDEPPVSEGDIELIRRWIENGMPTGKSAAMVSLAGIPDLPPAPNRFHHVGAAEIVGDTLVVGKLGRLEARSLKDPEQILWSCGGLAGKVNSIRASADQTRRIDSSGVAGLKGPIAVVDTSDGSILSTLEGHSDSVYCAAESPDGKLIS